MIGYSTTFNIHNSAFRIKNNSIMLNIVLFGPPGAGKGTQSQFLREKYNLTYISTGEILREEIAAESE